MKWDSNSTPTSARIKEKQNSILGACVCVKESNNCKTNCTLHLTITSLTSDDDKKIRPAIKPEVLNMTEDVYDTNTPCSQPGMTRTIDANFVPDI